VAAAASGFLFLAMSEPSRADIGRVTRYDGTSSAEDDKKNGQNDRHAGEHPEHQAFAAHDQPHWPKYSAVLQLRQAIQLLAPRPTLSVIISTCESFVGQKTAGRVQLAENVKGECCGKH
jgi:hypothetical protein